VGKGTSGPSASSGFPVGLRGFGEAHAAVRKAAYVAVDECCVVGNPELAPNDKPETWGVDPTQSSKQRVYGGSCLLTKFTSLRCIFVSRIVGSL
jgi:hypothetical protein